MTRKRRSGISGPEAVLRRVIRVLEGDDRTLADPEADPRPLLRVYHAALVDLLAHGPLLCEEALAREREVGEPISLGEVGVVRAELLQLLGSAKRMESIGRSSTPIFTNRPIAFTVRLVDGRAVIAAAGETRSLIILQTVLLLQEVGLANVQKCSAPDCRRLFVKVYRREFCSVQCQKRIYTRTKRRLDRERKEYLARRRRQRRKKGA
jgi:hypothetical protein